MKPFERRGQTYAYRAIAVLALSALGACLGDEPEGAAASQETTEPLELDCGYAYDWTAIEYAGRITKNREAGRYEFSLESIAASLGNLRPQRIEVTLGERASTGTEPGDTGWVREVQLAVSYFPGVPHVPGLDYDPVARHVVTEAMQASDPDCFRGFAFTDAFDSVSSVVNAHYWYPEDTVAGRGVFQSNYYHRAARGACEEIHAEYECPRARWHDTSEGRWIVTYGSEVIRRDGRD